MYKLLIFSILFITLILNSKSVNKFHYEEGFSLNPKESTWKIKKYPGKKMGLVLMASPKKKSDVEFFSITIKPLPVKDKISKICSNNKYSLENVVKMKVQTQIYKKNKNSTCYINYIKNKTEQIIFKTKRNFVVALTVENKNMKKRTAKEIFKLFKIY